MATFNWDDHPVVDVGAAQPAPVPTPAAFNWDEHPVVDSSTDSEVSPAESFAREAVQGPTLGFNDELSGAAQTAMQAMTGGVDKLSDLKTLYTAYRDAERRKNQIAEKANPTASKAGMLTGGLATALVPGMGEINSLKKAAAIGGLAGLGSSDADLTKGEVGRAALDTGVGAGLGATVQKVIPGIGKAVSGLKQSLEKRGEKATASGVRDLYSSLNPTNAEMGEFRAAQTPHTGSAAEDIAGMEDISLPKMINKYVRVKGGPEETERLVQARINEIEAKKKPLFDFAVQGLDSLKSDQISKLNADGLVPKLNQLADDIALNQKDLSLEEKSKLAEQIKAMYDNYLRPATQIPKIGADGNAILSTAGIEAKDPTNLIHLDEMKKEFGKALGNRGFSQAEQIAEGLMSNQNKAMLEAKRQAYDVVRDQITNVGDVIGGNLGSSIKRLNLEESNLIKLQATANKAANAEAKSPGGGVATGIFGGAGASIGAGLGSLAAGPTGATVGGGLGFAGGLAAKSAMEDYLGQNVARAAQAASGAAKQKVGTLMSGAAQTIEGVEPQLGAVGKWVQDQADAGLVSNVSQKSPFRDQKDTSNLATYDNDQLSGVAGMLNNSDDSRLKTYGASLNKALQNGDMQSKNAAIFLIMQNPKARQQLGLMKAK